MLARIDPTQYVVNNNSRLKLVSILLKPKGILHIPTYSQTYVHAHVFPYKQQQKKEQTSKQHQNKTKQKQSKYVLESSSVIETWINCTQILSLSLYQQIETPELVTLAENELNLYFGPFYFRICIGAVKVQNIA